jgi:hypothetical protein
MSDGHAPLEREADVEAIELLAGREGPTQDLARLVLGQDHLTAVTEGPFA